MQGAYSMIAPGGSLPWTVTWIVARVPAAVQVAAGSQDLVAFAASLVP